MGMKHFQTRCLKVPRSLLVLLTLAAGACGAWQRVGREVAEPDPTTYVTPLFDLEGVYNGMGLFAAQGALPFTGSLHSRSSVCR
jgi:hypothetical protein